jgi:hypothetical protein
MGYSFTRVFLVTKMTKTELLRNAKLGLEEL